MCTWIIERTLHLTTTTTIIIIIIISRFLCNQNTAHGVDVTEHFASIFRVEGSVVLMMEAALCYQTTWLHIPENCSLNIPYCENFISH